MAALRARMIEGACMIGLVIMAAFAGYLAHHPDLCTPAEQINLN
jgi:hypothetical protein